MTQLIEKVTITVTLCHDEVNSSVYGHQNPVNLHNALSQVWPRLCPWPGLTSGRLKIPGVEIKWEASGLEEAVEAGDN